MSSVRLPQRLDRRRVVQSRSGAAPRAWVTRRRCPFPGCDALPAESRIRSGTDAGQGQKPSDK